MSEILSSKSLAHQDMTKPNWRNKSWYSQRSEEVLWPLTQRIIAGISLLLLAPLFALLWVAVRGTSRGPFIYKQNRPGLNGTLFAAYKIRTMRIGADKDKARARRVDCNDPMITGIGKILRDLKLDELPQLLNVAKGEMVLVGPRPIAPTLQAELSESIPGFSRRLTVKPGITSLAQICLFDNADSNGVVEDWSTRFEAELDYIYRRSASYDLVIIALTIAFLTVKVFRKLPKKLFMLIPILFALVLSACSERLATHEFVKADAAYQKGIEAYGARTEPAVMAVEPISIPADSGEQQDPVYRVGNGDKLSINVFGEEGLDSLEVVVDGAGFIQVPILERIQVAGFNSME